VLCQIGRLTVERDELTAKLSEAFVSVHSGSKSDLVSAELITRIPFGLLRIDLDLGLPVPVSVSVSASGASGAGSRRTAMVSVQKVVACSLRDQLCVRTNTSSAALASSVVKIEGACVWSVLVRSCVVCLSVVPALAVMCAMLWTGKFVRSIGSGQMGSGADQFNRPNTICCTLTEVHVGDRENKRIQVVTSICVAHHHLSSPPYGALSYSVD